LERSQTNQLFNAVNTDDVDNQLMLAGNNNFLSDAEINELPNTEPQEEETGYFGKKFLQSIYKGGKQAVQDTGEIFGEKLERGEGIGITSLLNLPGDLTLKTFDREQKERTNHLKQITNNRYTPNINTIEDYVDSNFNLQLGLGFADNREEYINGLKNQLSQKPDGEDRIVDVLEDEREDKPWYMPRYYISVEQDDGSMTNYSNPHQSVTDFVARAGGQLGFDIAAGSLEMGTAATMGMTAAKLTASLGAIPGLGVAALAAAPFVGGAVFLTSLYTAGATAERTREEYMKNILGLTEEEEKTFGDFVNIVGDMYSKHPALQGVKQTFTDYEYESLTKNPQEEFSAWASTVAGPLGRVLDKVKSAGEAFTNRAVNLEKTPDGLYVQGRGGLNLYPQMIEAAKASQKFNKGGKFGFLNVPFSEFMLSAYTPNKLIERLSSLAQQTSTIIPDRIKLQNKQLADIMRAYGRGEDVTYNDFREPFEKLFSEFKGMADTRRGDFDTIARSIGGLDELFSALRYVDAKLKYKEVFDRLGEVRYDLNPLKNKLGKIYDEKVIAPNVDAKGKTTFTVVEGQASENYHLKRIIAELRNLGDPDGKLDIFQSRKAKDAFIQENKDFLPKNFTADNIDTPAEILHTYAIVLGKLAYGRFAKKELAGERRIAMDLRNTLLDTIVNPQSLIRPNKTFKTVEEFDAEIAKIKPLMDSANKFYKDTLKIRGITDNQISAMDRLRNALEINEDPGEILNEMIGAYGVAMKRGKITTLQRVKEMGEYVEKEGPRLVEEAKNFNIKTDMFKPDGTGVTKAFAELRLDFEAYLFDVLANQTKIRATSPAQADAFEKLLKGMDQSQKNILGITKEREDFLLKSSEQMEQIFDDNFMKSLRYGAKDSKVTPVIKGAFEADDFDTEIGRLLAAEVDPSKLKDSILQYLFDPNGGVAFRHNLKNSPYFDANEFYMNTEQYSAAVRKILSSKVLAEKKVFSDTDREFLDGIHQLGMALEGLGKGDAGVALAGAQIIGELFTIDAVKLLGGVGRLAAQGRISKLFTSPKLVNFIAGISPEKKQRSFLGRAFFGYGSLAEIVTEIAIKKDARTDQDESEISEERPDVDDPFDLRDQIPISELNRQTKKLLTG